MLRTAILSCLICHCLAQYVSQFNSASIPQSLWIANQTFTGVTYQVQCASMCATRGQCQYLFNSSLSTCQIGNVPIYQTGVAPFLGIHYKVSVGQWNPYGNWTACSVTCGYGIQSRTRTCQDQCSTPWSAYACPGNNTETQTCNTKVSCTTTHVVLSSNYTSVDISLNPAVSPNHNKLPVTIAFAAYRQTASIVIENGMLMCGGFDGNNTGVSACYFYGFGAASGAFHSNMNSPRGTAAPVLYKNRSVWMVSGAVANAFQSVTNSTETLNPANKTWTVGPTVPQGLMYHCVAAADSVYDQYFVIGGQTLVSGNGVCSSAVYRYSFSTGIWTTMPSTNNCHTGAACGAVTIGGGTVIVVAGDGGGSSGVTVTEFLSVSSPTAWTTGPALPQATGAWGSYMNLGLFYDMASTTTYQLSADLTAWTARSDISVVNNVLPTSVARGFNYQYCPNNCDYATCATFNTSYGGVDFSSSVSSIASASACKDLCQHMSGCPFYSYSSGNSTCYFKTTNTVTSSNIGFTSGPATCGCLQVGQAYDISTYIEVFTGITDAELCQWYCIQDLNCEFMVYYTKGYANPAQWMNCYKLGWPAIAAPNTTGVISGVKICP